MKEKEKENLVMTTVRLPVGLKSRLMHLLADGRIKSIQAAVVECLTALADRLEKEKMKPKTSKKLANRAKEEI
jgi:hypothetical protein